MGDLFIPFFLQKDACVLRVWDNVKRSFCLSNVKLIHVHHTRQLSFVCWAVRETFLFLKVSRSKGAMSASSSLTNQTDFETLLKGNGVPADVIDFIVTKGCKHQKAFANWVDKKEDVKSAFFDECPQKTVTEVLAAIKQSWREAEAMVARGVKRTADGISEEHIDDPLPEHVQTSCIKCFGDFYKWNLTSKLMGSDSLLGRCKRESDRWAPSNYPLERVRNLAQQSRHSEKRKHKASERMTVEIDGDNIDVLDPAEDGRLRTRLFQLEVLANTWAVAGCVEVTYETKKRRYIHWQEALKYHREMKDRVEHLLDKYSEESVIGYFVQVEALLRAQAIESTRHRESPVPWGQALLDAIRVHSGLWADHKDLLQVRKGGQMNPSPQQPQRQTPSPAIQNTTVITPKHLRKTCAVDARGHKLCKKCNDRREQQHPFKSKCSDGSVHGCDYELASTGKACGSTSHNRDGHDESKHGQIASRGD